MNQLKQETDKLFMETMKHIIHIDNDVFNGCPLAKAVQQDYETWQRNVMNKEAALRLQTSLNKWKEK
jgi:hypothetical protein